MNYNRISHNVDAIKSDGTNTPANNGGAPTTFGTTLAPSTTYMIPFGDGRAPVPSQAHIVMVHMRWDNAIAFTATVEECGFPAFNPSDMATGVADVSDVDTTVGNWIITRPSTAYVEVVGGGTYTPATGVIAVTAAQQGGMTFTLSLWGGRRGRVKIVVGGTGGLVRTSIHGKCAA